MASRNWIAKATSKNKGAEKASAQKAGMSTMAYAESKDNSKNPTTKRRAVLTETLAKLRGKK